MVLEPVYCDLHRDLPGQQPRVSPRSLELFTGAGGLALGTYLAGFQHEALVEWNRDACETLVGNARARALPGITDWRVRQADARAIKYEGFGDIDLVAGGPPCQPFSIAGKHRGMEDPRDMIPEFIRAVREVMPRAFILENVRGLRRPGFRTYFSYALFQLSHPTVTRQAGDDWSTHLRRLEHLHSQDRPSDLHYNVVYRVVNAADHGVPQVRERIFLVGFRSDTGVRWRFPEPTHSLDALLHEQWITGDYWERHGISHPKDTPTWVVSRLRRCPSTELFPCIPWRTVRDAIGDLPEPREDSEPPGIYNHRLNPGAKSYVGHTGSPLDLPAKTLKAGDHGVPGGENMIALPDGSVRYFTVREAARVQTFPDSWRFSGAWSEAMRQLGNAVPVQLGRVIAEGVAAALGTGHG